ncbi:MAG: IS3 family transposase [Mycobacteriaceae bacterium]
MKREGPSVHAEDPSVRANSGQRDGPPPNRTGQFPGIRLSAAAEPWNATFKKELIHLHSWKNVEHVRQASFEFVEVYYNRQRIQKGLGYLTPSEYELGVDTRMAQVA